MGEYVGSNTRATWGEGSIRFEHRRLGTAGVGGSLLADLLGPTLEVQASLPWSRVAGVSVEGSWVRLDVPDVPRPAVPSEDPYAVQASDEGEAARLAETLRASVG